MLEDFILKDDIKIDNLTQLYTRETVFAYVERLIELKHQFLFSIIDVDNFKTINDNYGHHVGDEVLAKFAETLKNGLAEKGVVGRFGGDEFIVVIDNIQEYNDVWSVLHEILNYPTKLTFKDYGDLNITITIGASRHPLDALRIEGLFELADKGLYRGKTKGRNCFIIYLPEKHANIDLKAENDKQYSSMYLHSKIYRLLTKYDDLATGVKQCIDFIGSYLMIDHLCLATNTALYFDYYHPICKDRGFFPIKNEVMETLTNKYMGLYYENKIDTSRPVYPDFIKQNVVSTCHCEISAYGKFYGYVRADIVGPTSGRIWQSKDIDLLINFAHILAIILYYQNKRVEDLEEWIGF